MIHALIFDQIQKSIQIKQALFDDPHFMEQLQKVCDLCVSVYQNKGKLLVAGNGGSAADAQHMAGELVSRFYYDRPALPAIALTTDSSILTAIGNDYGYESVFSRQVEAHGQAGDVLVVISTSGNSPNVIQAIEAAKKLKMQIVGLTGMSGGKMAGLCDICLKMPSNETPRIQEGHLLIEHIICAYIEMKVFPKPNAWFS